MFTFQELSSASSFSHDLSSVREARDEAKVSELDYSSIPDILSLSFPESDSICVLLTRFPFLEAFFCPMAGFLSRLSNVLAVS